MKPVDVKDNACIDSDKDVNDKDAKFKVGDHVRISKYKNIFAKGYTPKQPKAVSVIRKVTCVINERNGEEIIETFYEQKLQKTIHKNLGQKK